jgi:hypothetical protein
MTVLWEGRKIFRLGVFLKNVWLGGPKQEISKKVTTSQDDGLVEEVENIWLGVQEHGKSKKSQALRMTVLWEF